MPTLVSGSIATDHLMHFPGKFSEQLLADKLDTLSVSFPVDDLQIRRGGVAPNICFGMAALGGAPVLIGAVGDDFADYRAWLDGHGVNTGFVHVAPTLHTARFVCTTDDALCQIGSFYPGAMAESRHIELAPAWQATGADLVVISASDPAAMVRQAAECRERGFRFAADPSQAIAAMDAGQLRAVIDGAEMLFTNEYEKSLLESKTGLSQEQIRELVAVQITTLGANGALIAARDAAPVRVGVATVGTIVDPTGVGDAFRAGLLTAREWGLGWELCAQVGATLAAFVLEAVGPQEYTLTAELFRQRLAESFGEDAAARVAPHLSL